MDGVDQVDRLRSTQIVVQWVGWVGLMRWIGSGGIRQVSGWAWMRADEMDDVGRVDEMERLRRRMPSVWMVWMTSSGVQACLILLDFV